MHTGAIPPVRGTCLMSDVHLNCDHAESTSKDFDKILIKI